MWRTVSSSLWTRRRKYRHKRKEIQRWHLPQQRYEKGGVVRGLRCGRRNYGCKYSGGHVCENWAISLKTLGWIDWLPIGSNNTNLALHNIMIHRLSHIQHRLRADSVAVARSSKCLSLAKTHGYREIIEKSTKNWPKSLGWKQRLIESRKIRKRSQKRRPLNQ